MHRHGSARETSAIGRVVVLGVGLLALLGVASGCAGERLAEQLGEQAIDGNVEIEDDSLSITDQEGNELGVGQGTEIPASWPDEVPLYPNGKLVLVTSQADGTATALWESEESTADAVATYDAVLLAAGFALEQDSSVAGTVMRTYSTMGTNVNLTVASVGGRTNVNITVIPE